ncbi:MAG: UDP-N-acetylmuramoyl-L-alanyl-D-glutamate--2,6-diaminopimelate ligase [Clostridiales bacterium]|jgi:UDP-N-acetylmuramoyl-L-alanyl-D-glutamate--2,6-diaminopimelate ligase|nr:UDP-N-acetylmuramoyl-L-alanyl-D-glutamate--2,6-diaminopimelate ligase [Clostridiales bacterium]
MKLSLLLDFSAPELSGVEITSLAHSTADAAPGALFFCLEGHSADGHIYAGEAVKRGAAAIVASRPVDVPVPVILVENTRSALARAAHKFFGEPSKRLKTVAVTGTNGKTTTTYIIKSILDAAGKRTGIIGTNAIMFGSERIEANLTTPDPIELHSVLKRMADAGIEYVVAEASAHALALDKLDGIVFDVAAFTNLSRDHLDFFGGMDEYFAAKKKLFTPARARYAVINADDPKAPELWTGGVPYTTYGCLNPADVFSINLKMSVGGLRYVLNMNDDIADVKFNMPGKFNMYNTLCAAAVAGALGIKLKYIVKGIRSLIKVDGRFNIINTSKCSIIIDFAHTDDGLRNILTTVREFAPRRIITVFGCGGDRDKTKRPVMGAVVSRHSDLCILTSDNPRTEKPEAIIAEILEGIEPAKRGAVLCEADRKKAILSAIERAGEGDVVVIAGKGAERYQDVMGRKMPYNDEQYVLSLLKERKI